MNWKDAAKASADSTRRRLATTDTSIFNTAQPMGWDPHDVWLTRVRRPRMVAASAAFDIAPNSPRRRGASRG